MVIRAQSDSLCPRYDVDCYPRSGLKLNMKNGNNLQFVVDESDERIYVRPSATTPSRLARGCQTNLILIKFRILPPKFVCSYCRY